jgi:hypothetical protein
MPALSSSLTAPVVGHLADLAEDAAGEPPACWRCWAESLTRDGGGAVGVNLPPDLVITILRLAGAASIAAALRYHARRPGRPLQTIIKC